jgi:ABC-type bacteriocin/lantibiotic exporter with double-glycine peptidase domain
MREHIKEERLLIKKIKKIFIRQRDQSDCGVACLSMVIRYFGGEVRMERLRELSGTNKQGTTLLGLYQSAKKTGLDAGAFKADILHLQKLDNPSILHVIKNDHLQHYVVCYGYQNGTFIIADPADSVKKMTPDELKSIWKSKALLVLKPGKIFQNRKKVLREKVQWFKDIIEQDLNILGLALAIGIIISILNLSTAIFSQKLIDDILPNGNILKLIVGLSLLAFILIVKNGLMYIRRLFLIGQSRDFNNRIIQFFYNKILYLPQLFFDSRKTGDLIARMYDISKLQQTVTYLIGQVMIHVLIAITSVIFIMYYSVSTGMVALLCIPFYIILVFYYQEPLLKGERNMMHAHALNESNYIDTIQGIPTIKVGNRESFFGKKTATIYGYFQNSIYRLGKIGVGFNFFAEIIGIVLLLIVLGWTSYLVILKTMMVGVLVAILQMTNNLIPSIRQLVLTNIRLQEARVAFDRMYEFTSLKPEYDEIPQKMTIKHLNKVEITNLSFRFPGRKALLTDVSFSVEKGELIALLGESGSGKSTTLKIIQRLYLPEKGNIVLNSGQKWNTISTPSWRNFISVVPQQVKIFNGSLMDNLCLADTQKQIREIISFCREYGLERYFLEFPQGYNTQLGENGIHISGGQRQLVALARALYQRPQLLLLDEVTSAMDRKLENDVFGLLSQLKKYMGIILVTHRVQSSKFADRIYIIENGVTSTEGSPFELSKSENLFSKSLQDTILN